MSKNNPFVGYTVEEIFASEAVTYVIQMGLDVFHVKGKFVFNKKSAVTYYNKILNESVFQLSNGDKRQKANARLILSTLKIMPLRIH